MKLKEIDFSKYDYRRICIVTEHGTQNWPEDSDTAVKELHGELEINVDTGIVADGNGWLQITPSIYEKKPEETKE